ncbi:MAG: alpha/beta hydrolase [Bacteroidetes bacterium]|nr:alpha/beta hydrolase [Bacteroidota bacterium]
MSEKPSLLLLHGALGSAEQLEQLANALQEQFSVHCFNFAGHGGEEDLSAPFSIARFAIELEAYLQAEQLKGLPVFGYSMGGYVALYLACRHPAFFTQILTLGTKFGWSPQSAAREVRMLQPDVVQEKVPQFAQMLATRHHPLDWRQLMEKTAAMMLSLGDQPALNQALLSGLKLPVTIMRGSQDRMVSEEESRQAAEWLPQGRYKELAGQPHPLEQLSISLLADEINKALNSGR